MVNLKLVEVYAVLLILCTALVVFGVSQMQVAFAEVLSNTQYSYAQTILKGIQISAAGMVTCTVMMVLFFRYLKKKYVVGSDGKKPKAAKERN